MPRPICRTCEHDFYAVHLDHDRWKPTPAEKARRRCNDCVDCHPPEDAAIRESVRDLVNQ